MSSKKISKEIAIQATAANVWKVLTEDQYTRQWYAEFMPGSHAVGTWGEGEKISFQDNSNSGILAKINTFKPYELIEIEYTGWLDKGNEDYDGPIAQAMKGGKEIYRLEENNGATVLHASAEISPEMYDEMNELWDKAAVVLTRLAESI